MIPIIASVPFHLAIRAGKWNSINHDRCAPLSFASSLRANHLFCIYIYTLREREREKESEEDRGKSKEIILTDGRPLRLHMKSVRLWIDTPLLCPGTCLSFSTSPLREGTRQYSSTSDEGRPPEGQTVKQYAKFSRFATRWPLICAVTRPFPRFLILGAGVTRVRTKRFVESMMRWKLSDISFRFFDAPLFRCPR